MTAAVRMTADQSQALRDRVEERLEKAVAKAIKAFLAETIRVVVPAIKGEGVTASAMPDPIPHLPDGMPALGHLAGLWAGEVDQHVTEEVEAIFQDVYASYLEKGLEMTSPYYRGLETFAASARDRLVVGEHFGVYVYQGAYDDIRATIGRATALGHTTDDLAENIAKRLGWAPDNHYWTQQLSRIDSRIDDILDPLGPPGTPAREAARLYDPTVQTLRDARNDAIRILDREKSIWETRATLIARTEATGATNLGALAALKAEGATHKRWVATLDVRTRDTHANAHGEIVGIDEAFRIGDGALQFPGDPSAPVQEVANCRCTIVDPAADGWQPDEEEAKRQAAEERARQEAEEAEAAKEARRQARLEKRWKDKPAPEAPARPIKPKGQRELAKDAWMRDMNARYDALGTGKTLDKSYNYHLVTAARDGSMQALDDLLRMHYVDQSLYQRALEMARMSNTLGADAKKAHERAMRRYYQAMGRYRKNLADWREVNGVGALRGMFDDVLTFATNQDAYDYVTKNLPRISHGASRDSLTRYTGSGYSSVNTLLRQAEGGALGNSTAATHIRNIDKAMDASRLADDVLFYRGSSFNEFSLPGTGRLSSYIPPPEPESLIGTVHTQHGYWSVSYGGVDAQGAFGGNLQLVIRAPKGTQAVDATQLSRFGTSEREVILGRGQQFFIHSVEWRNPQGWVAEVEILPKGVTADMVRGMVPMPRPK